MLPSKFQQISKKSMNNMKKKEQQKKLIEESAKSKYEKNLLPTYFFTALCSRKVVREL